MKNLARIVLVGFLVAPLALAGCCGHHKHHDKHHGDKVTGKMKQEHGSK